MLPLEGAAAEGALPNASPLSITAALAGADGGAGYGGAALSLLIGPKAAWPAMKLLRPRLPAGGSLRWGRTWRAETAAVAGVAAPLACWRVIWEYAKRGCIRASQES